MNMFHNSDEKNSPIRQTSRLKRFVGRSCSRLIPRSLILIALRIAYHSKLTKYHIPGISAFARAADPDFLRRLGIVLSCKYKVVKSIDGFSYLCDVNDHIGYWLYVRGYFDLLPTQIFTQLLTTITPLFYLDLGANIGTTMIPLASKVPTLAVDMNDNSFYQLSYNNYLANSKAILVKAALAENCRIKDEFLTSISYYINPGNAGSTSMLEGFNKSKTQEVRYAFATSIDHLLSAFCDVDKISDSDIVFAKIDLEGLEHKVLKHSSLLRSNIIGLIEYRPDLTADTSAAVIQLLISSGFEVRTVVNLGTLLKPSFKLFPFDPNVKQENVIFYKESSQGMIDTALSSN